MEMEYVKANGKEVKGICHLDHDDWTSFSDLILGQNGGYSIDLKGRSFRDYTLVKVNLT